MRTRKTGIISCFVIGALLCTLTSCGDRKAAASENVLTVAEAGFESLTEEQDIRKASLEEHTREIVKASIKSTEQGDQTVPPMIAVVRIAGASVRSGAADYETAVHKEQSAPVAVQSQDQPETAPTQAAQVQETAGETAEALAPELTNKVLTTVDTYQNIRKEPSEDSEIVGRLYEGSAGDVLEAGDGWTKISSGGVEGWVHNEYVVSGEAAQDFAEEELGQVAVVKEDGIRVRAGASIDSAWIGVVNAGESYTIVPEETEEPESTEENNETAGVPETEAPETQAAETAPEAESQPESQPAAESQAAAPAAEGQTVQPTAESQTAAPVPETEPAQWVKIIYEDGKEGYVCADYVTVEFDLGKARSIEDIKAEEKAKAEAEAEAKAEAAAKKKASSSSSDSEEAAPAQSDSGWVSLGEFKITAYCGGACCNGKWAGTTASGATPSEGRTIAVAPWIIPYGTQVRIDGLDGTYVAEDTGGFANSNPYQIDLFVANHSSAGSWGVRYREVWVKR